MERLGRFYPIHVVTLLLFIGTEIALAPLFASYSHTGREAFAAYNSPEAIISNLLLVHSWGIHNSLTWNFPAWSLSTEWAAYLYFAFTVVFGGRRFLPWAMLAAAVSAYMLIFVAPHHMSSNHDFGVFRSLLGFAVGAMAFYAYRGLSRRWDAAVLPKTLMTCLEVLALATVIAAQMSFGLSQYGAAVLMAHMVLMIVFAFGRGHLSDLLSLKPIAYLGAISLSVYMTHAWLLLRFINVASLIERFTGIETVRIEMVGGQPMTMLNLDPWVSTALAVMMMAVVVGVSHYTYKINELPGQQLFRIFANRFRQPTADRNAPTSRLTGSAGAIRAAG
jgi:peptidoglycan/LPS O-acetylase OafA/YrhL